jgi:hypothetical protein
MLEEQEPVPTGSTVAVLKDSMTVEMDDVVGLAPPVRLAQDEAKPLEVAGRSTSSR